MNQLFKISEPLRGEILQGIDTVSFTSDLDGHAQFIRYYDEVLTQSARNYAFTGNKIWEERYRDVEPKLDYHIKYVIEQGDEMDKSFFISVDKANIALVEMEYKSIELVNKGKNNEAIKILESKEYWNKKRIYEQGLRDYVSSRGTEYDQALVASTEALQNAVQSTEELTRVGVTLMMISLLISVGLTVMLSFFFHSTISAPIVKLRNYADKVSQGKRDFLIQFKNKDEISQLGSSFVKMVQSIDKSTRKIKAAEEKYRGLYEESPDLYRTINKDGIILDCNKSYAKTLGYKKSEVIGSSIFSHTANDSINEMRSSFETWRRTGLVTNREVRLKKKDNSTFPVLVSATNLYDIDHNLIGSNTIIKDISEISTLLEIDKSKNEFASMISHELRTPLVPIMGYCEMLQEPEYFGKLGTSQKEAINEIYAHSVRLNNLIGLVLKAQKLEMDRLIFHKENFKISEFLKKIFNDHLSLMNEKKIEFVINFTMSEDSALNSDNSRLHEVFTNLIQNAVDFVPLDGGKIEIGVYEHNNEICFFVKDNGIGIPKEKQKKLFTKFYQIDTSMSRKHGGSGLGLVICKGIVNGLGGKIGVDSSKQETAFTFSIPKSDVIECIQ